MKSNRARPVEVDYPVANEVDVASSHTVQRQHLFVTDPTTERPVSTGVDGQDEGESPPGDQGYHVEALPQTVPGELTESLSSKPFHFSSALKDDYRAGC